MGWKRALLVTLLSLFITAVSVYTAFAVTPKVGDSLASYLAGGKDVDQRAWKCGESSVDIHFVLSADQVKAHAADTDVNDIAAIYYKGHLIGVALNLLDENPDPRAVVVDTAGNGLVGTVLGNGDDIGACHVLQLARR